MNKIVLESNEESCFYDFLKELESCELITDIKRSPVFVLAEQVNHWGKVIMEGIEYTPDFAFKVLKESNVFQPLSKPTVSSKSRKETRITYNDNTGWCYVEVKPSYDVRGKTTEVNIKRKWVYAKHNVFVELVKIPTGSGKGSHLFKKMFTPKSFLLTSTKKAKVLSYKPKLINEYVI